MPNLDVGHYGPFIWPAYGLTVAGVAWMIFDSLARARRWRREVEAREAAKRQARDAS